MYSSNRWLVQCVFYWLFYLIIVVFLLDYRLGITMVIGQLCVRIQLFFPGYVVFTKTHQIIAVNTIITKNNVNNIFRSKVGCKPAFYLHPRVIINCMECNVMCIVLFINRSVSILLAAYELIL